jgi:hypothetical protein
MKNAFFWDIKTQFVLHRRHIISPLHSPARFEVFTAVTMKNAKFLRSVLRLPVTANAAPSTAGSCQPGDGGYKFLRKVGSYKSHTA